jgi:hypothetical protein
VTARADLQQRVPLNGPVPAKTFVLEVHTDDPGVYLEEVAGKGNVHRTDDVYLSRVFAKDAGEFWVDRLNPRFWSFHTVMSSEKASRWLSERVQSRRDTDWMWLPSDHLRNVAPEAMPRKVRTEFAGERLIGNDATARDLKVQLTGVHAEQLLDKIAALEEYRSAVSYNGIEVQIADPDMGTLREAVKRRGSFAANGDNFAQHAQFVRSVVTRYSRLIDALEAAALSHQVSEPSSDDDEVPSGLTSITGTPIGIRFSRHIDDLTLFCGELFSAREPFRLWGRPVILDDVATVEAVDLHVGQRITIDIGRDWMRVYLRAGCCGNTVARLVSNLQSRFDSALTMTRPDLQEAISLSRLKVHSPAI